MREFREEEEESFSRKKRKLREEEEEKLREEEEEKWDRCGRASFQGGFNPLVGGNRWEEKEASREKWGKLREEEEESGCGFVTGGVAEHLLLGLMIPKENEYSQRK